MSVWPKYFIRPNENDPFWISIDLTERPFKHTKTNMKSLMVVSVYFRHSKVFIPVFFALMDDDSTSYGLTRALQRFKSDILDNVPLVPQMLICSPEPQLITAMQDVFRPK